MTGRLSASAFLVECHHTWLSKENELNEFTLTSLSLIGGSGQFPRYRQGTFPLVLVQSLWHQPLTATLPMNPNLSLFIGQMPRFSHFSAVFAPNCHYKPGQKQLVVTTS